MNTTSQIDVSLIAKDLVKEVCEANYPQSQVKSIINNLIQKADACKSSNLSLHSDLVEAFSEISEYYDFEEGVVIADFFRSNILIERKEWEKAAIILNRSLKFFTRENNTNYAVKVYNSLAAAQMGLKNNDLALKFLFDSLRLQESFSETKQLAETKSRIGLVFYALGNRSESLAYHHQAISEYKELDDHQSITNCLLNIGIIYLNSKQLGLANQYFNDVLNRLELFHDKKIEAKVYFNIGNVYYELGNKSSAINFYEKSLDISLLEQKVEAVANCHFSIGKVQFELQNYDKAIEQLQLALSIYKKQKFADKELLCYKFLIEIYEQTEDYKNALYFERIKNKLSAGQSSIKKDVPVKDITKQKKLSVIKNEEEVKVNQALQMRDFASMVSHDLREPLRSIIAYSEMLHRKYKEKLDEKGEDFLDQILDSGKFMSKMLTDLKTYALAGVEDKEMEDCDLNDIFKKIKRNLYVNLNETNTELIVPENLPTIHFNYTKLIQLFQNLISNGIKFNKEGIAPKIEILYTENDTKINIGVKDNGIGIPEDSKKYIFNIFKRLNYSSSEGTGVGLAICEQIANQIGGEIKVESLEGEGSTFTIQIPKSKIIQVAASA